MATTADIETRVKRPSETRLYDFDFSKFTEFKDHPGTTIASVSSIVAIPVTIPPVAFGASSATGAHLQVPISGGLDDTPYLLTAVFTTSNGAILEGNGFLYVTAAALPE